jgi:hypothetical protein
MTVDPKGMRSAADYMMKLSGVDPIWLREAADEIERLRERLGPRGLEVIMIDGAGHYVNEKVKAEIERLRALVSPADQS